MVGTSEDRSEIAFFDVKMAVSIGSGQGFAILKFGAILVCPRKLVELQRFSILVRLVDLSHISTLFSWTSLIQSTMFFMVKCVVGLEVVAMMWMVKGVASEGYGFRRVLIFTIGGWHRHWVGEVEAFSGGSFTWVVVAAGGGGWVD
ncbi:NEN1-like [Olea europaea subsp. europaea]|uniref:NEN1-like n=1 Tax=Olea europaea subsp. europaea TaxID=158383 RepID=A0A8S0TQF0_OLEEU|nr:NEN1-like [Olea europaea subsp. europaea]